jgi:segregation and condensation protein A
MTVENQQPEQTPVAVVKGEAVLQLPLDLYIPPEALEVILEQFSGPLDLLLYLIRRQNLDILDIPIAEVTRQYMGYIDLMQSMKIELAAEYLLMAAMLAEIKSRMLLPRPLEEEGDEADPRAELVRRLQEYERYRVAAENIERLPRVGREVHLAIIDGSNLPHRKVQPNVSMFELLDAFREVLKRAELYKHHHILREPLSVRERMTRVLDRVNADKLATFESLFDVKEGRAGLVVTFLAILELLKESLILIVQQEPFSPIHVKVAA